MLLIMVVSNIIGDDYVNWGDGENIVDCGEDRDAGGDSIGDSGLDTNGGINPDFRDDKTKVGCSDNTAGDDGNSNDDVGPNDVGVAGTNDNNCDANEADTDGGNNGNVVGGDKNDGDGNEAAGGSNAKGGGGNEEGGDNSHGDAKDSGRDDSDDKDNIDFEDDDGVSGEFLQSNFASISTIFGANLNNLWSITTYRVIGLYEPSWDLVLSNICRFHLYRIIYL